ncbi:DUF2939 domain-containing protein [Methylobacterium sp. E-041]|jgi:hypothetical protein|uniref:DUF2939 domain-containing protein n=1 Tax=unclassified Methylobacterium TaxID=2615210 RepID=UPI0011CCBAEF|nr:MULTISPECIES: DUF2939 domain-containing protein [unclassified Methylobacterium]MCJ2008971.1 DUF2939 domain-containing protein [Methylobacterium sp. J-092]MCJ2077460.1 DUF2939 domain-containing protein [Methylobacterium sp. E-016]MCJ2105966.1 DUF2939 domain-containing protein [Methylobacterium sp. E-041]MCJ2113958.1 DUF2939 domain-containing protein [Methylobacterium sp. E-025]TXM89703.1 DUF2939 domain-containing protein [Methylobacterium sp. WL116]
MRWWVFPLVAVLGWFAFTLTPLWTLYDFARAVRAHDVAFVQQHANFRTLRLSLVRQTTAALRSASDNDPTLDAKDRQRLNEAAVGVALALAESMVTPETVLDLLDDGWPQSLDIPRPDGVKPSGLRLDRIGRVFPFWIASEMRGFRTAVIAIPPDAPRAQQLRVRLRLRGWTWRLVDIEVAEALRDQMAQRLGRTLARARAGERAPAAQP